MVKKPYVVRSRCEVRNRARTLHRHRGLFQAAHTRAERAVAKIARNRARDGNISCGAARSEIDPPADGRWRRACFPHEPGSAGEVCDGDCARIEEASRA